MTRRIPSASATPSTDGLFWRSFRGEGFTGGSTRVHAGMPNIGRSIRRAIRPLWIASLGAAAWSNRAKVQEALGLQKPTAPGKPVDGDSVTVRTTTATWTNPLRRRAGSTGQAPSSVFAPDVAATLSDSPTPADSPTLADSATFSEEV